MAKKSLKESAQELIDELESLLKKYEDLNDLHFLLGDEDATDEEIDELVDELIERYPFETGGLMDSEKGEWDAGFNFGCLQVFKNVDAALRDYVSSEDASAELDGFGGSWSEEEGYKPSPWTEEEEKYERLVWYARSEPLEGKDQAPYEEVRLNQKAGLAKLYPKEIKALHLEDTGNWAHGFNSGCLASYRFTTRVLLDDDSGPDIDPDIGLDMNDYGLEHARDQWPELDT